MSDWEQCIRCDEVVELTPDLTEAEYIQLTYDHEALAMPICLDCFNKVRNRDVW